MKRLEYLKNYNYYSDSNENYHGSNGYEVDNFIHVAFLPLDGFSVFQSADRIIHRPNIKGDKDDFSFDRQVDSSEGRSSWFADAARSAIINDSNDLSAILNFAKLLSPSAWSGKAITLKIGDDAFVFAVGNQSNINVSANDDVFVFAPSNKGTITAKGEDVFIYAPDNDGSVFAMATAITKAFSDASSYAKKGDAISIAVSIADADTEVYIFSPNNDGRVSGVANATALAKANADARASGDAVSVAVAEAIAEAHVLIRAANDHGQTSASATAYADAFVSSTAQGSNASLFVSETAVSEAHILIG